VGGSGFYYEEKKKWGGLKESRGNGVAELTGNTKQNASSHGLQKHVNNVRPGGGPFIWGKRKGKKAGQRVARQ